MSNLLGLEEDKPNTTISDQTDESGPDPDLVERARGGAKWFYWIAALSVINSAAFIFGANFHFLAGLGLTEIADAVVGASIEQGAPGELKIVSVVFDLTVLISFALIGYFANKLSRTAFILGIVAYAFDALIVLVLGDYLMAGFHAFALFFIFRGFFACRQLKQYEKVASATTGLPPPPPASL
jgi:hypothetical protein